MNTSAKGANFERLVVKDFVGKGFFAFRMPASQVSQFKGCQVDVVAFSKTNCFLISCKTYSPVYFTRKDLKVFNDLANEYGFQALLALKNKSKYHTISIEDALFAFEKPKLCFFNSKDHEKIDVR